MEEMGDGFLFTGLGIRTIKGSKSTAARAVQISSQPAF
jgi:hypothetical protein